MMETKVLQDLCIGCALCPSLSPELYVMEDDGKATTLQEKVPPDLVNKAIEAADSCPVNAIVSE